MVGSPKKATNEQLIAAYERCGSVWIVAKQFGMCGQSVHERLRKLGLTKSNEFTADEIARLICDYETYVSEGRLDDLAISMGRPKHSICRVARKLCLTDPARKRPYLSATVSARAKDWHATHEHPRGMLGKPQSERAKRAVSISSLARWAGMTEAERAEHILKGMRTKAKKGSLAGNNKRGSWKAAWREIGGQRCFFRSMWEANYARYLQWLLERGEIAKWEHEPETFWFEAIKRGVRSYLPDFRVTENNGRIVYHEVKGWMDDRSRTTIARMARYHPNVKLIVIDGPAYKKLSRDVSAMIAGWETKDTPVADLQVAA